MSKRSRLLVALSLSLVVCMLFASAFAQTVTEGIGYGHDGGEIHVNVTQEGDEITSVEITSHNETAGISDPALEQIPQAIVENQTSYVDTVSGATDTSNGIKEAVRDALKKAGFEDKAPEDFGSREDYERFLSMLMGSEKAVAADEYYAGLSWIADRFSYWEDVAETHAPEVRTLKNGVKVQRTPSETSVYAWQISGPTISYNTYFLDADNRGCGACHEDLNDLLRNMKIAHPAIWNDAMDNYSTVETCMFCHEYTHGYCISDYDFGTFIHGMHYGNYAGKGFEALGGNCLSCHNMTKDGQGMAMWDVVKYDKMVGILKIPDVEGKFDYTQDTKQTQKEMFTVDWLHSYYDALRRGTGVNGSGVNEYPQRMYDEWTIEVGGNVYEPYTAYLKDLVQEAEEAGVVVTKLSKKHCTWNPVGAAAIGQVEITGIPVAWLIDKAGGYKPDSTGVNCKRACGGDPERSWSLEHLPDAYLVYKINGEPLDATHGAPCSNWVEGVDAQSSTMTPDRYYVRSADDNFDYGGGAGTPNGWYDEEGDWSNNPNATILGVPEGLIVETGVPHVFNGYADAYVDKIAKVEFSMDGGKTWTTYEVGDTDPRQLLTWTWEYTPEMDGSYVLTVRAVTEDGRVSKNPHRVMFTAKSDVDEQ